MPIDPQIEAMLAAAPPWPGVRHVPLDMLRQSVRDSSVAIPGAADAEVASVADRTIAGPGGDLALRIYTPQGTGPFPVTVYMHGGGFVVGDLDTQDMIARALCAWGETLLISVDYRLAPEHPFPAAYEDCRTVWQAMQAGQGPHAINLRRLVVIGDSAGGNLAAALCLGLRDDGQPLPGAQVLIYPGLGGPCDLPSRRDCMDAPLLSSADTDCYLALYLRGSDQPSPYAMPLLAVDFSGLPKAFIAVAQFDPLRDDGRLYAERLQAAGVATVLYPGKGLVHGCLRARRQVPEVDRLYDDLFNYLGSEGLTQV